MPASYNEEAVRECERLYLLFNGQQHDRVQAEMRKKWPSWSKQNLYTRGKGSDLKIGWIDKFGWEKALELKLALSSESVGLNADEKLVRSIEKRLAQVEGVLDAKGAAVDRDLMYQFRDLAKLLIEARTKLETRRDTLGGFVAFWERLLDWLPEMNERAARELLKVAEQILERAAVEYGEKDDRAKADRG
ncbi:MAG TPA: hypothetical protein VF659_09320 [Pyrinomonadaceae bacterium]|jgi:hypothetical protein